MAKRQPKKRPAGPGKGSPPKGSRRRSTYSPAELFMAAVGALLIVLFLGIVITSILGD